MVPDPTDLLTLPVLFLSWQWWHSIDVTGEGVPRRAWGLLVLASLATLGNATAPDYGIVYLREKNGEIVAAGGPWQFQGPFISRDGGLTWREEPALGGDMECPEQPKPQTLQIPESSEVYRFEPGVRVELSRDGGRTWATEIDLGGHDARAGLLYLTPFILWGFGIVSRYHQALLGAVVLVAVPLLPGAYGIMRTRRADHEVP